MKVSKQVVTIIIQQTHPIDFKEIRNPLKRNAVLVYSVTEQEVYVVETEVGRKR